jgi:hypothetical protein
MTSNVAPERTLGSIAQGVAPVLEGLVAIAPVVGTARVASAAGNILTRDRRRACGCEEAPSAHCAPAAEGADPRRAHHVCRPCQLRARGGLPTMNAMEDPS